MPSTGNTSRADDVLWTPPADVLEHSRIGHYLGWLEEHRNLTFPDYHALWEWSVTDLDAFWTTLWEYFRIGPPVTASWAPPTPALAERSMPGARWFPTARVNYAAHLLREAGDEEQVAVLGRSQARGPVDLTAGELRRQVARCRAGLARLGVGRGDRVAAYLPNIPETLVAFLATASLGAVWASCAPEFGTRSVLDRFSQIDPTVLLAVDGYRYGDKAIDRRAEVAAIREGLPGLAATVAVPYLDAEGGTAALPGARPWSELLSDAGPLARGSPAAPLSSISRRSRSTTRCTSSTPRARPACPSPSCTATAGSCWSTPSSWPSASTSAPATVLLVLDDRLDDVEPSGVRPGRRLGRRAVRRGPGVSRPVGAVAPGRGDGATYFGASAPFLLACRKAGLEPARAADLSRVRVSGRPGRPCPRRGSAGSTKP